MARSDRVRTYFETAFRTGRATGRSGQNSSASTRQGTRCNARDAHPANFSRYGPFPNLNVLYFPFSEGALVAESIKKCGAVNLRVNHLLIKHLVAQFQPGPTERKDRPTPVDALLFADVDAPTPRVGKAANPLEVLLPPRFLPLDVLLFAGGVYGERERSDK